MELSELECKTGVLWTRRRVSSSDITHRLPFASPPLFSFLLLFLLYYEIMQSTHDVHYSIRRKHDANTHRRKNRTRADYKWQTGPKRCV